MLMLMFKMFEIDFESAFQTDQNQQSRRPRCFLFQQSTKGGSQEAPFTYMYIYTRCSMGGAKAPPHLARRSVAPSFRRTDAPTGRSSDAPKFRRSGPSVVANQS